MKRLLIALSALLLLVFPTFAQETKRSRLGALFDGSLALSTGLFFGRMNEFVYQKGRAHELSRLEWEEYFVPCLNLNGELAVWNFFLDAGVTSAAPVKGGAMRDYDYEIPGNDEYTKFSEHDAMLDKHFQASLALGYTFAFKRWYIAPGAGFFFRNRKWSAVDGYTKYPENGSAVGDDTPEKDVAGTVITYEEIAWMPSVFVRGGFFINRLFEAGARLDYYPYMNVATVDTHVMRQPASTRYHDFMSGASIFALAAELWVRYRPKNTELLCFTVSGGWQGVFPDKGTTESGTVGYDTELVLSGDSQSRTESSLFWVNLGVIVYPKKLGNIF